MSDNLIGRIQLERAVVVVMQQCHRTRRTRPRGLTRAPVGRLRLDFDVGKALELDDVAHAPDYKRVASTVATVLQNGEWRVSERMPYDVAKVLLFERPMAQRVAITVAKDIVENASPVAASLVLDREGNVV